jgi:hypothetical protein
MKDRNDATLQDPPMHHACKELSECIEMKLHANHEIFQFLRPLKFNQLGQAQLSKDYCTMLAHKNYPNHAISLQKPE